MNDKGRPCYFLRISYKISLHFMYYLDSFPVYIRKDFFNKLNLPSNGRAKWNVSKSFKESKLFLLKKKKDFLWMVFIAAALASPQSRSEGTDVEINEVQKIMMQTGGVEMPMGGSCENTCGCHQRCRIIWWMPCFCTFCTPSCRCCSSTTTTGVTTCNILFYR